MLPVYLNNYNRLETVLGMLTEFGRFHRLCPIRLTLVDNGSTYGPLIEWYSKFFPGNFNGGIPFRAVQIHPLFGYEIRFIRQWNKGPRGFWNVMDHREPEYCVCDPDLDLSIMPDDSLTVLLDGLRQNPNICKVGPSIKIDDIPELFPWKDRVLSAEGKFYQERWTDGWWWKGEIDTAFMLARTGEGFQYGPALRSPAPYEMRHLPFYAIPGQESEEERFYIASVAKEHKPGLYWSTIMQDSQAYVA